MIAEFVSQDVSHGFCPVGEKFDANDPAHQQMDAARYACWIQEAKDAGNYVRADEVRSMAQRFGGIVRSTKAGTHVIEGLKRGSIFEPVMPDYDGWSSWVNPEDAGDRRVIDVCYTKRRFAILRWFWRFWFGSDQKVHSVKVMNWEQHPNYDEAKRLGLPLALWSKEGQLNLANMKSTDWFLQQFEAVEAALFKIAVGTIMERAEK